MTNNTTSSSSMMKCLNYDLYKFAKTHSFSATAQLIGAQTVEPSEKLLIADRDSQNNSVPGHLDINNSADWTQCLYQSTKWRSS